MGKVDIKYLGKKGAADAYEFTRTLSIDANSTISTTRSIAYLGTRTIVFSDANAVVVIAPDAVSAVSAPKRDRSL